MNGMIKISTKSMSKPGYFMNRLLRPRIWPSFLASSGLPGTRRKRLRCAWHTHLHGLATAIEAPCSKLQGSFEM
jgi:hypothetical protein